MRPRLLDGPQALALGLIAGGCTEAWVTTAALSSTLSAALSARLPGVGGQVHTLRPVFGEKKPPAAGDPGAAREPVTWVCTGEEALDRLDPAVTLPPAAVLITLPPSPGLSKVLSAQAPRYIWAPGSSRMAYRLAAAACREAGSGSGPCCILLDGELPPETVAIPADQVPGLEEPPVRTDSRRVAETGTQTAWIDGADRTLDEGRTDLQKAVSRAPAADDLLPFHYAGPDHPDLLLVGTGTSFGELARAWTELLAVGQEVAHLHVRQLRPLPIDGLRPIWIGAQTVVLQESPGGGLAEYLENALPGRPLDTVIENLDHLAETLRRLS